MANEHLVLCFVCYSARLHGLEEPHECISDECMCPEHWEDR